MTALVLFPSRIRFVNPDGTLTPEAFRALSDLLERTGGTLGDSGVDTYADVAVTGLADSDINVAYTDVVQPQSEAGLVSEMVQQPITQDIMYPDVNQPTANGINTTITTASLVGKTITVQDGLIIGFA